jgi:hypothetical protein
MSKYSPLIAFFIKQPPQYWCESAPQRNFGNDFPSLPSKTKHLGNGTARLFIANDIIAMRKFYINYYLLSRLFTGAV